MQLMGWMIYAVWTVAVLSCAYRITDEDWEKHGRVRLLLRRDNSGCLENMTWYFYAEGSDIPIIRTGDMKGMRVRCLRVATEWLSATGAVRVSRLKWRRVMRRLAEGRSGFLL